MGNRFKTSAPRFAASRKTATPTIKLALEAAPILTADNVGLAPVGMPQMVRLRENGPIFIIRRLFPRLYELTKKAIKTA